MDIAGLGEVPEKNRRALYTELAESGIPAWLVCYTPGEDTFARVLDPVKLARELPGMRWFDLDARREASDSTESSGNTCRLVLRVIVAGTIPKRPETWPRKVNASPSPALHPTICVSQ